MHVTAKTGVQQGCKSNKTQDGQGLDDKELSRQEVGVGMFKQRL